MKVNLKNSTGVVKRVKLGFSWTTFFFGGWVAMYRGQWGEFFKWFFLNPITLGIWGLMQCWTANNKTIVYLIEKGYTPATNEDRLALISQNVIVDDGVSL
ncbi:hypothetical protein QB910_000126 [Dabrowskivirus KKP3916]|uniref:TM2 domain-containing protein n=1 Tax=Alicyclobacillus phage KKP_3916 TaxID=3040651 RepID=A0AAT9V8L2_9CAUD|nr:hypothetical protein QB910_000126 [Alicyclobacillus phage KKP 3916]